MGSDPDQAAGCQELRGIDAWRAVWCNPLHLDVFEWLLNALTEPLRNARGISADLQGLKGDGSAAAMAGMHRVIGDELHKEWQLRVGLQTLDTKLLPQQFRAVTEFAIAIDRFAAKALLVWRDVVNSDNPTHPAAAKFGASAHGLPERSLVGCGMVEDFDDLKIGVVGERKDPVASAEARVDASTGDLFAQQSA
mgnify:FL=1